MNHHLRNICGKTEFLFGLIFEEAVGCVGGEFCGLKMRGIQMFDYQHKTWESMSLLEYSSSH